MRVLLVLDSLDLGGLPRVAVEMANGLTARGWTVRVMAAPGPLADELTCELLPVRACAGGPRAVPTVVRAIRRETRRRRYDAVHVHQRVLALAARVATTGSGVPVVEQVHSLFWDKRRLSFRSPHLVACAPAVARHLVEHFPRPSARVHVVENAVRGPAVPPPLPAFGNARLLAVGRVEEPKRPEDFASLVAALRGRGVPVTGRWVGDGPLRDALEAAHPHVEWWGADRDVERHLRWAHALVSTSEREGMPLVVLEAFAAGRPVFARAAGGIADVVEDGVSGLLWDGGQPLDLVARRVASTLADHGELLGMGGAARRRYEDRHTPDHMLTRLTDVLGEACA